MYNHTKRGMFTVTAERLKNKFSEIYCIQKGDKVRIVDNKLVIISKKEIVTLENVFVRQNGLLKINYNARTIKKISKEFLESEEIKNTFVDECYVYFVLKDFENIVNRYDFHEGKMEMPIVFPNSKIVDDIQFIPNSDGFIIRTTTEFYIYVDKKSLENGYSTAFCSSEKSGRNARFLFGLSQWAGTKCIVQSSETKNNVMQLNLQFFTIQNYQLKFSPNFIRCFIECKDTIVKISGEFLILYCSDKSHIKLFQITERGNEFLVHFSDRTKIEWSNFSICGSYFVINSTFSVGSDHANLLNIIWYSNGAVIRKVFNISNSDIFKIHMPYILFRYPGQNEMNLIHVNDLNNFYEFKLLATKQVHENRSRGLPVLVQTVTEIDAHGNRVTRSIPLGRKILTPQTRNFISEISENDVVEITTTTTVTNVTNVTTARKNSPERSHPKKRKLLERDDEKDNEKS